MSLFVPFRGNGTRVYKVVDLRPMIRSLHESRCRFWARVAPTTGAKGQDQGRETPTVTAGIPADADRPVSNLARRLFRVSPPLQTSPGASLPMARATSNRGRRTAGAHGVSAYTKRAYGHRGASAKCTAPAVWRAESRAFSCHVTAAETAVGIGAVEPSYDDRLFPTVGATTAVVCRHELDQAGHGGKQLEAGRQLAPQSVRLAKCSARRQGLRTVAPFTGLYPEVSPEHRVG